jgi:hypothetical protein
MAPSSLIPMSNASRLLTPLIICLLLSTHLPPDSQADGIVLVKTNQAVLVGQYSSPILPGEATKVVENLADYLLGVGY